MTSSQATVEVFLIAFRALPKKEQDAVLAGIIQDESLREDLLDIAVLEQRRNEPSSDFKEFLAEYESRAQRLNKK
jgi:hypothetical protein